MYYDSLHYAPIYQHLVYMHIYITISLHIYKQKEKKNENRDRQQLQSGQAIFLVLYRDLGGQLVRH